MFIVLNQLLIKKIYLEAKKNPLIII